MCRFADAVACKNSRDLESMVRKLLIATIYSTIAFCVISYVSVMVSLLSSLGDPTLRPVCNIGLPFNYYYQFWLRGNPGPNSGWNIRCFEYDCLITWIVCTSIYLAVTRRKQKV